MDEQTRKAFAKEFNGTVGELLHSLRDKAGLSLNQVAEALAASRLEKIKRIEAGTESPQSSALMELVRIYGADPVEVNTAVSAIGVSIRSRLLAESPRPDPPPSGP